MNFTITSTNICLTNSTTQPSPSPAKKKTGVVEDIVFYPEMHPFGSAAALQKFRKSNKKHQVITSPFESLEFATESGGWKI